MEQARATDPTKQELREVMAQWAAVIGTDRVTVRRLIDRASRQTAGFVGGRPEFDHPDLREALLSVAGQGGAINGRRLGRWLSAHAKQHVGDRFFEQDGIMDGSGIWRLVDTGPRKTGTAGPAQTATPEDLGF